MDFVIIFIIIIQYITGGPKKNAHKIILLENVNSELLKLLHIIFLTISSIAAEIHSPVQGISENIAIFFNLFIITLFKT